MTRNAIKMLYCGQQNFMFAIHYSSKPSPAFLAVIIAQCIHGKKTELLWQGTCNKNTYSGSGNRIRFCHMRQQAGGGLWEFPGGKQREQELRDWALLAEWLDGKREEKWRCHYSAQWQNDIQEKPQWNQAGQKYNSQADTTQARLRLQNILQKP